MRRIEFISAIRKYRFQQITKELTVARARAQRRVHAFPIARILRFVFVLDLTSTQPIAIDVRESKTL